MKHVIVFPSSIILPVVKSLKGLRVVVDTIHYRSFPRDNFVLNMRLDLFLPPFLSFPHLGLLVLVFELWNWLEAFVIPSQLCYKDFVYLVILALLRSHASWSNFSWCVSYGALKILEIINILSKLYACKLTCVLSINTHSLCRLTWIPLCKLVSVLLCCAGHYSTGGSKKRSFTRWSRQSNTQWKCITISAAYSIQGGQYTTTFTSQLPHVAQVPYAPFERWS